MDDVPARRHRQLPMPRTSCTPRRRIESTVKKNSAATSPIRNTIAVVTRVSFRDGQVTLAVSCRTCRKNSIGLTFAIPLYLPVLVYSVSRRSEERRVGKECAVRVDLGGRRIIQKKRNMRKN